MKPIYAIGDVHGQFEMLATALERIEDDGGTDARVVVLGDLVDRGPDSFRVIELLRLGVEEGRDWTVLRGNHDQMFLDFLSYGNVHHRRVTSGRSWFDPVMGGRQTLASYGVTIAEGMGRRALVSDLRDAVPESHVLFLAELPLYHVSDGMLFVHAGIQPGVPLEKQEAEDLLWMREPFLSHEQRFDWLVVHGHTALDAPRHYGNRVNLDSGAGFGRDLTVAVFEEDAVFTLGAEGRARL